MADEPTLTISDTGLPALTPGDGLTFGRTGAGGDALPHLGLSDNPRLHALAGRIDVDELGWLLTNTGRWLHLRVAEAGTANRVDVPPGRTVRIPYPDCRVQVTTGDETIGFDARCPWLARVPADRRPDAPALAGATVDALGLDRGAGYFRALVALCAPRLHDPGCDEVASVAEIARTLNRLPQETERVTAKAVERRLAHVRRKVGLTATDPHGRSAAGLELRDASRQLADLALRTGTVTPEDLALIGPEATQPARSEQLSSGPRCAP